MQARLRKTHENGRGQTADVFSFVIGWNDNSVHRAFLLITYAVNYAISGLLPQSYHALNLILHFIASLLVFVRDRPRPPVVAGL